VFTVPGWILLARGQQRFKRPTTQPVAAKVQAGDASVEHQGARKRTTSSFTQKM